MVFIAGGSRFLGINLIRYLLGKGIEKIISFDLLDFDYPEKEEARIRQLLPLTKLLSCT